LQFLLSKYPDYIHALLVQFVHIMASLNTATHLDSVAKDDDIILEEAICCIVILILRLIIAEKIRESVREQRRLRASSPNRIHVRTIRLTKLDYNIESNLDLYQYTRCSHTTFDYLY